MGGLEHSQRRQIPRSFSRENLRLRRHGRTSKPSQGCPTILLTKEVLPKRDSAEIRARNLLSRSRTHAFTVEKKRRDSVAFKVIAESSSNQFVPGPNKNRSFRKIFHQQRDRLIENQTATTLALLATQSDAFPALGVSWSRPLWSKIAAS